MSDLVPYIVGKYNYWAAIILMLIGLYGMIAKNNLLKKVVAMSIFQTAIILFYVSIGVKKGGAIPIVIHHAGEELVQHAVNPEHYANPLPHVLMLTAIVVGVATLGVALAILQKIQRVYDTIEEDEILEQINEAEHSEGLQGAA
ncbi:MAG: cation:proton antiporter subunit C [Thermodesulfobacteriota bacterium]